MNEKIKEYLKFIKICKNWYSILPFYLRDTFLRKCEPSESKIVLVKCRNGLKFFARSRGHDLGFIVHILHDDEYRFPKKRMGTVIDIGAHIGIFTCLAASYADKVISLEPCPDNFSLLKKNVKLNGLENVISLNMALSEKNGKEKLYFGSGTGDHSLFIKKGRAIEVKTCSLNYLFERYKIDRVSFLKIDCEGCEYQALKSFEMFDRINQISLDSHHGYTDKIVELLKERGFKVFVEGDIIYATNTSIR